MKQYYPTINLLRGLAAFMVCFFHFSGHSDPHGPLLPEGDIVREVGFYGAFGVFIFFVISGFVIPLSMHKYDFKLRNFGRFIARRWIRIEIPYIVSIFLYMLSYYLFCRANGWPFEFNAARFFHHIFYTIPFSHYEWLNVIYWTLAIEFQFYILIGLIYPLLVHKNQWISTLTILAFVASGFFYQEHRLIFYYAPIFALGITLFRIKTQGINKSLGWLLLALFSVATFYVHGTNIGIFTALTVLCIAFVNIDRKIFNWTGNISYSLYLIHGVIGGNFLYFLSRYGDSYWLSILILLGAILSSVLVSYLFWLFVEGPSQKLSKRVKI